MSRDPNDFSPRSSEPLPPHVPLDEAAITRLWEETSPQARAMRAKDSHGSRPEMAEADTSTAPAGGEEAGGDEGAGAGSEGTLPAPGELATLSSREGISSLARLFLTLPRVPSLDHLLDDEPPAAPFAAAFAATMAHARAEVARAQAIAWVWRRCWERYYGATWCPSAAKRGRR